ncbi:MAG: hypothetical protein U0746_05040 [Gemmataceae bacterium]
MHPPTVVCPPRRVRRAPCVALAAAAFGVAAFAVRERHLDHRLRAGAAALQAHGAIVNVITDHPDAVRAMAARLGLREPSWLGRRTVCVQFPPGGATAEDARVAAGLPNLCAFDCFGSEFVGDDALAELASATGLTAVRVNDTRVTDAGVHHLMSLPRLKGVAVKGTLVGDAGLRLLRGKPRLDWIEAGGPNIRNVRIEGYDLRGPGGPDNVRLGDVLTVTGRLVVAEPDLPTPKLSVDVQNVREAYHWAASISGNASLTRVSDGVYDFTVTTLGAGRDPGRHAVRVYVEFATTPQLTYAFPQAAIDIAVKKGSP